MALTFYFYDTETSGIRPSSDRIMQFAGRRTGLDLVPIGEPDDILIQLHQDVLPDPYAVLIHGITPQQTLQDGITEADFCRYFNDNIATPGTIFVGFNNVRFDDEFVRYTLYRNFYEPYEWQWKDNRSRWDILDALRMMRALRPSGIEWPFDNKGGPTVRLESMTAANGIGHENAHTALADVDATIAIAKLMKQSQPKLFDYLLNKRAKKDVAELVANDEVFLYTSGKYAGETLKTTVVYPLLLHPKRDATIVYDLRFDPTPFLSMNAEDLAIAWRLKRDEPGIRLPIKTLQHNRCPAIAPLSVLDAESKKRIAIDVDQITKHAETLKNNPEFKNNVARALGILDEQQEQLYLAVGDVDTQLYQSFWNQNEKQQLHTIRSHAPATLAELLPKIHNKRLQQLLPLYKARNYKEFLTPEEYDAYESYRSDKLYAGGPASIYTKFVTQLQQLSSQKPNAKTEYLLTELQLYAESILPASCL